MTFHDAREHGPRLFGQRERFGSVTLMGFEPCPGRGLVSKGNGVLHASGILTALMPLLGEARVYRDTFVISSIGLFGVSGGLCCVSLEGVGWGKTGHKLLACAISAGSSISKGAAVCFGMGTRPLCVRWNEACVLVTLKMLPCRPDFPMIFLWFYLWCG